MKRICSVCSKVYVTYPCKLKKGWQHYCSKLCSSLARGTKIKRICVICGKEFIVKRTAMKYKYGVAKYCSRECQWKGQKGQKKPSIQGDKAPNWRGGIQNFPYPFEFNDELKETIRKRDNHACQSCGLLNEEHILIYGYDLVIHHVDYIKKNCDKGNLITLCIQCNSRVNFNRTYWTDLFMKKMEVML